MIARSNEKKVEFGDFQTPAKLALEVCELLARTGFEPSSILEPTCGKGAFLEAALKVFPKASVAVGFDCNPDYVNEAQARVEGFPEASVEVGDFFEVNWEAVLKKMPCNKLILGNPPWVTNSTIGSLKGDNLPSKSNQNGLKGIEAITGSSNFDISEWMLRQGVEWVDGESGLLAVLCKTAVARKVLAYSWSKHAQIKSSSIYGFCAKKEFEAAVDACLLVVSFEPGAKSKECRVYEQFASSTPAARFGIRGNRLVSNLDDFDDLSFLYREGLTGWRSGIKHDCSRVFELQRKEGVLLNGLNEPVSIEEEVLFPLLKSSDLFHCREHRKLLLLTQQSMSESPLELEFSAPRAWEYLLQHSEALGKRGSSIYKKRPQFSIFGIGAYSLTPWKVAISGLYKEIRFSKVGLCDNKPVLLDDTCYLFPCETEEECQVLFDLVTSPLATRFFLSLTFWDSKRPITAKALNVLDLGALAKAMNKQTPVTERLAERQRGKFKGNAHQHLLFKETR